MGFGRGADRTERRMMGGRVVVGALRSDRRHLWDTKPAGIGSGTAGRADPTGCILGNPVCHGAVTHEIAGLGMPSLGRRDLVVFLISSSFSPASLISREMIRTHVSCIGVVRELRCRARGL